MTLAVPRARRAAVIATAVASILSLTASPARGQTPPAGAGENPAPAAAAFAAAQAPLPGPTPPIPASAAVLFVEPFTAAPAPLGRGPAPVAGADAEASYQRRILTHAVALGSEHNVRRALRNANSEIRKTRWFVEGSDPLERATWLRDHLRVAPVPGTSLIRVELPDVKDAADRKTILQEVCAVYLESTRRASQDALLDRTSTLNNVKIKVESRLKDLRQEMRAKQVQLNVDGGGIGRIGVKEMELNKLVGEQVEAQVAVGRAEAAYQGLAEAAQRRQDTPGVWQFVPRVAPFLEKDRLAIHQSSVELEVLAAATGPEDPKYKALAKRLEVMKKQYQTADDEARAKARVAVLEDAQTAFAAAKGKFEALTARVNSLKNDLGELSNSMVQYFALQEEQKGLTDQLRAVREQIENVMAIHSSAAATDVRWHLMPEAGLDP
jgi:uncharacterized coiled-coil DUF342 family protein